MPVGCSLVVYAYMLIAHSSAAAIRVRCARAVHQQGNHDTAPHQAPPDVCNCPQRCRGPVREGVVAKGAHCPPECAQVQRRWYVCFHDLSTPPAYRNKGHINHSLFWKNLAPSPEKGGKGGVLPEGTAFAKAVKEEFGSLDELKKKFNTATLGIQGSGWGWLVRVPFIPCIPKAFHLSRT